VSGRGRQPVEEGPVMQHESAHIDGVESPGRGPFLALDRPAKDRSSSCDRDMRIVEDGSVIWRAAPLLTGSETQADVPAQGPLLPSLCRRPRTTSRMNAPTSGSV
jgi:hypothetical protein